MTAHRPNWETVKADAKPSEKYGYQVFASVGCFCNEVFWVLPLPNNTCPDWSEPWSGPNTVTEGKQCA